MVQLPKNCTITEDANTVYVKAVYSTKLSVGRHFMPGYGKEIEVFKGRDYVDKNGKFCKGKHFYSMYFKVNYGPNWKQMVKDAYFKHKEFAMNFTCDNGIESLIKRKQELKRTFEEIRNQLPSPPRQITLQF